MAAARRETGLIKEAGFDASPVVAICRSAVRYCSWLCKNAKRLKRDRISYSSKTALVVQLAIEFNLEVELKNIILVAFRYFEFLHSQGQKAEYSLRAHRVRFAPESGLTLDIAGGPFRANKRHGRRFAANSYTG